VGTAGGHGFIYHGGTWAKVAFPQSPSVNGTQLFDTTVGLAGDLNYKGHPFKRYSNGSFVTIQYPGAQDTWPRAINSISNNNVIVGQAGSSPPTSFLYANGVFKIILAPNSNNTQVQGISGDGLITGITFINGMSAGSGFLATCQ
jgi:hypothetical protein